MLKESVRYAEGCVFEGMTSVSSVINSEYSDRKIIKVIYDAAREEKLARALAYLRRKSAQLGFEIEKADAEALDSLTVGQTHGGVAALCTPRTIRDITDEDIKPGGFYVYIEGIEDPYNFGFALRSVYAAGASGALLSPRNWMSAAGVVCRSSAGASELMPLYTAGDNFIDKFRVKGYKIYCADAENAQSVYDTDCSFPLLLVVGGEKRGISRALLSQADKIIKLDYGRDFKEALSAASAASVLAFEIMRQNR